MMISMRDAEALMSRIEQLTAGGGVTTPDDMVSIDDVEEIIKKASYPYEGNDNGHTSLCIELNDIYRAKNHDYGNSFSIGFEEYGMVMAVIRLEDKMRRLKQLLKNAAQVDDERVEDTLMDMANYAIMTVMELRKRA